MTMPNLSTLLDTLAKSSLVEIERGKPIKDVAKLAKRVKPHFGKITWTPPPSYASVLAKWGPFAAVRDDAGFDLLGPTELAETNEDLVHMPEGVSRDEGVDLTTNHLVGFAATGGEAVFCFDVTQPGKDGEYPVYYHHQDEPRARVLATGAWDNPKDAKPDFASFTKWLETMTKGLTAKKPPPWLERLGDPFLRFR